MKRSKMNFLVYPLVFLFAGILLAAFVSPSVNMSKEWDIPAKYKEMKNPHVGDKSLERVGKMLYAKHCKSCHGNIGLGDGPKAASMETKMIPFNDAGFQGQSDGAIYYQSIIGRDEMPNFEKKIPDEEDRWALINFIRTLK
jgi:mono/diheme cytochrome c family protein